jgi:hypothetical protein
VIDCFDLQIPLNRTVFIKKHILIPSHPAIFLNTLSFPLALPTLKIPQLLPSIQLTFPSPSISIFFNQCNTKMHLPLLQIILFLVPLQICETQASSPANPASNPKLEDHYHTHHPWTWALPPSPTPAVTTQEISTLTISSLSISTVTVSEIQIETFTASSDDSVSRGEALSPWERGH